MTDLKRFRETKEQRKKELHDFYCYDECIKQGCTQSFLDTFRKRMFISPIFQTKAFIDLLSNPNECLDFNGTKKRFEQWCVFLRVLEKKRTEHEKHNEWIKSLEIANNFSRS